MLAAGTLDRRIELLTLQETSTSPLNESVREPVLFAEVWAALAELSSSERITAGQGVAEKTRVFKIRHLANVKPGPDRMLRYNGELFDITAVDPLPGRESGLRIVAIARAE